MKNSTPRSGRSILWTSAARATQNRNYSILLDLPIGVGATADASLILARPFIALKLNAAYGAVTTPLGTSVPEADALLGSFSGRLPYAVQPSTAAGQTMVEKAALFENFNNGALTNGCGL